MNEHIGEMAGHVWHQLDQQGPMTVSHLKEAVGAPSELLHQAIGWLARENKISFQKNGRSLKIILN